MPFSLRDSLTRMGLDDDAIYHHIQRAYALVRAVPTMSVRNYRVPMTTERFTGK